MKCTFTTLVRNPGGAPSIPCKLSCTSEERNVLVQHYNKPLLCDFLADRSTMSSAVDFHKSIFGCLPVSSVGLISIAVPFSVDWEGVTLYPGIIMSSGAQRNQGLNTLFLEFPDVEGWLEDDFTQAMMAQIELAETVFNCDRLVVCVDSEANSVVRTLQYVGFSILKENIVLPHHGLTVPVSQNTEFFFLQYVTEHCRQ